MGGRIALCIDELSCTRPGLIGLEGEQLESQEWLDVHFDALDAREALLADAGIEEAWVVSCDDVSAINLAAAVKADRPELVVRLLALEGGGSIMSRAHAAALDEVMSLRSFVEHYGRAKASSEGAGTALAEPPVLALPSQTDGHSAESLALELARPAAGPERTAGGAFIMPVVSGSGGTGKSTIAVLSAFIASARGCKTLLLDYDLQFGDAAVLAGAPDSPTIDEAIEHPDRLESASVSVDAPLVLAPPAHLEMAESVARAVPGLLQRLGNSFDVIVANTGGFWAEQHAALLENSTASLFLIDQRSSSVRTCRHALELCARCGIATGQFQFALNRCAKNTPLTSIDVSCALQGAKVLELRDGGRDVEEYLAAGAAAELLSSGNEFCASLERLLENLFAPASATAMPQSGTLDALLQKKHRGRHVGKRKGWGR